MFTGRCAVIPDGVRRTLIALAQIDAELDRSTTARPGLLRPAERSLNEEADGASTTANPPPA